MRLLPLLGILPASLALAGKSSSAKQPPDLVPYGESWSCFHAQGPGAEPPRCERTEPACNATRATLAAPDKMSPCGTQSTATVVTYFDPKRSAWRFLASPSDDGCIALRTGLVATRAYKQISQCEVVDKRYPPPAKLQTSAITPGKGWWCLDLPTPAPKGVRPACVRTVSECEESIRRDSIPSTKCKQHPTAFLVTFRDSPTAWGFVASTTAEACGAYRDRAIKAASDVSACTSVGEVARPKLDKKLIPRGRGWLCFEGADPSHPIGACARTAPDCAAQYELDRYVLGASAGCKPQSTAFARATTDGLAAFPSASLCEKNIADHPDGSRCEAVN